MLPFSGRSGRRRGSRHRCRHRAPPRVDVITGHLPLAATPAQSSRIPETAVKKCQERDQIAGQRESTRMRGGVTHNSLAPTEVLHGKARAGSCTARQGQGHQLRSCDGCLGRRRRVSWLAAAAAMVGAEQERVMQDWVGGGVNRSLEVRVGSFWAKVSPCSGPFSFSSSRNFFIFSAPARSGHPVKIFH